MKRILLAFIALIALFQSSIAQTGQEFWLAPPDVTTRHRTNPGDAAVFINITSSGAAATVTIAQPASPGWTDIVINIPANGAVRYDLSALHDDMETHATDAVQNTGLHISSTSDITAYYEFANPNNPDFMALKGNNGLGDEFYIPLHKHAPFYNHDYSSNPDEWAYASFDIVATQDGTTVLIYSPVDVLGHPALTPFTINLDEGETYSCANMDPADHNDPSKHPSGAVVLSDKPIAISIKDDSNHNPSGGCYDLMMDQIVPVGIVGTEYIAIKGQLNSNGDESTFIMATENNTDVYIDGAATPITTLFAGQYYRHDMDYLASSADNATHIYTTKPSYVTHVTGFGCEQGMAILPPLNCAGSRQLSFTRATSEAFFLNIMVRAGSEGDFTVTGPGTAAINAGDFQLVPGTGGEWMAAQIQYDATEVPVNQAFIVGNTSDVFSLAIINGGAGTGCRYGFFSEFAGEIIVDAGVDQDLCEGDDVILAGSVSGGSTTGEWTTTGSGTFNPDITDPNATYEPSLGDYATGSVTLTLTSTGACEPESDDLIVNFQARPIPDAGPDLSVCENNPVVNLNGSVINAAGVVWSAGGGTFLPSNSSLTPTYTPTSAEISAGTFTVTLTSTGNGDCPAETDQVEVTVTPSPTANAGADLAACANDPEVALSGSFTVATGGIWSGGSGTFDPSTTNMNANYTATAAEIASGSVILTLTTTGNGDCIAVDDQVTIVFSDAPTANAGIDRTLCENNADIVLVGSIADASGGEWSGGLGSFSPDNTTLNATYSPSASEIAAGSVTLTLTTTGNGNCLAETDDVTFDFTPAPTVDAGADGTSCANNPSFSLTGSVTVATGGVWSGGAGSFSPNNTSLTATYTPTAGEITAGTVTLTLTSAGNGTCSPVTDQVTYTITDSPVADAGIDQTLCANNALTTLAGNVTGAGGGQWSGGSGSFNPSNTAVNATYAPTAVEIANGSVTLTLTTTSNGNCIAVSDQMTISFTDAPTVNAGADVSRCENNADVSLNGSFTVATGAQWAGGLGTFSPSNTAMNATYTPTVGEIASGSLTLTLTTTGNGGCTEVTDDTEITFTSAPIADAGPDLNSCANAPQVSLNGSVTIATGGVWSGGAGTFAPNNTTLNATYTPSAGEIAAGSATLTLTTAGNGNCSAVTDEVTVTIAPSPVVDAGTPITVCANNPTASLAGSVSNATGGIWSGGAGTFNPATTDLSATYTPSAAEIASGSVTLTLTSTGNGTCNDVIDQVLITITDSPVVDAGVDQSICSNNADVDLSASVANAAGGSWSGGLGVFSPSVTDPSATYSPTATEIASGLLTLTYTSTGNATCNAVSDDMTIVFTASPSADAGQDETICENNLDLPLNGSVSIATGGQWSGGGGSFSPNANTLDATYTPSAAERALGTVTLTLTTTGNANCLPESDEMIITILPSPQADAGGDILVCSNNAEAQLGGSINGAGGGIWSGGAGTFSPATTALNAVYYPTPAEIAGGSLTLTLTSIGNGDCDAVSDDVTIDFSVSPTADAGADATYCDNNADISLNGAVTVATGGEWSGGGGVFTPSNTDLNAVYTPSAGELAFGSVTLTLTTTDNGNCNAVTDDVTFSFTDAPVVDAGVDLNSCANNAQVTLDGSVTIAAGGLWSGGTGSYAPNNSTLTATYTPSPSEIAAGSVTLTLTSFGNGLCNEVSDEVTITIGDSPTADAGTDITVAANNPDADLNGIITNATGGIWTGGNGTYSPDNTALGATYTPSNAEIVAGTVTLTLTTTGNGDCLGASDDVTITIGGAPTADAGADETACANNPGVALNGSVTIASGGQWSGGLGVFTPDNDDLNAVYTPTATEIANGSVTLTLTTTGNGAALPESDDMTITFTPAPTVDAGAGQSVCENAPTATVSGSVTIATGGTWSGGAGTYSAQNSLTTDYTATAAEIAAGTVTLTLTTTGNGNCSSVSDEVTITIVAAPEANAGTDLETCANAAVVQLGGSVNGATGIIWSGGTGTFSPDETSSNAVYTPSAAEITAGGVTLTLTSTGNGLCATGDSDDVSITITDAPVVDAGAAQTLCANNAEASLNGSVIGATGGQWSGGAGAFSPDNTTLTAVYSPTTTELDNGSVTLTLTSTGNGECAEVSDQVTLTFSPAPTADAGSDETVCANSTSIPLSGSVTVATGGIWSGGNGSFSPGTNSLNTNYIPAAQDLSDGAVTLYLTTTGVGNCTNVVDSMRIAFDPLPIVNSGPDQSVCRNNSTVTLGGFVGNATGGIWSGGGGTFVPTNTAMTPDYIPTAAEIAAGTVTLTLTSTGNASCAAVSDDMQITFTDAPLVDAGADMTACRNNSDIPLNGNVTNATGVQWSGGTGTFSPSETVFNPTYTPSAGELANGTVTLTLTSTGNGNCLAESDQVTIDFTPAPVVNAGADFDICENDPAISLNGTVAIATGGTWSGGLGTFSPDENSLSATYTPTAFEIESGSITLTLTTTGNGNCLSESDDLTITVLDAPAVDAGADQTVCVDDLSIDLNGSVSGVTTSGAWTSSGTGSFFPSPTALNGEYLASQQDSLNGSVTLTLTSTNNGLCNAVTDQVVITLLPAGTADAGADIVVCENDPLVQLDGAISGNATSAEWTTTGSGTFSPSNSLLNATYEPSAADIASGTIQFTLTINSCDSHSDVVQVNITQEPVVSAGPDQTTCVDDLTIDLNGSVSGISATGAWETLGSGTFSNGPNSLNNIYEASTADSLAQGVTLVLHATNIGTCQPVSDTLFVQIFPAAVVDAGSDMTFCANNVNAQLNGVLSGAPQDILWSTSGSGIFNPAADVLDPTYIPSAADTTFGAVTLTLSANNSCNAASDAIVLTLTPAPYVNAGEDQTYCETVEDFSLNGVVSGITDQGFWTTSGSGAIADPSSLNTTYSASPADIAAGQIDFFLTSQGNGNCMQVVDELSIYLSDGVEVDAGTDQQVCIASGSAQLNPTITNGSQSGQWSSSGTGTFSPSATALNADYIFSQDDIAAGSVTLIIVTTNNGTCTAATDQLELTFGDASFADAGDDFAVCSNDPVAPLQGTISGGAIGSVWSTSGTGFFDNTTNLQATYTLSSLDIANGGVDITLTTITDGTCDASSDVVSITVDDLPSINAGADLVVCTAGDIPLNANVSNASSVLWTTDGTGSFFDDNLPNTIYYPSQSDSIMGSITLSVMTVGSGECQSVSDAIIVTFGGGLSAQAGADQQVCSTSSDVQLNGAVNGTSTGQWTTNGTGTFSPSATDLNAIYVAGPADFVIGTLDIVLSTTDNQGCNPGRDTLQVTYELPPSVNAGDDILLCDAIEDIGLSAEVANAQSIEWTSNGTGVFSATDVIDPTYSPSVADSTAGQVAIVLTATPNGACESRTDTLYIDFAPLRTADAGEDIFTCADGNDILLSGAIGGAQGGVWTTTGNGTFSPSANALDATYTPSNTDLVFDELIFVLTTTGNSGCTAATDSMRVIFETLSRAEAGPDRSACDAEQAIELNGSITDAPTAFWTTTGTGTFMPDEFDLQATYQPSENDEALGAITLSLNTTGVSACAEDSDDLLITFINPLNIAFDIDNRCSDQEVEFSDASTITEGDIIAWNWDFGNGSVGTGSSAKTTYSSAGQYSVSLEVFSLNGCSAIYTELIDIVQSPVAGFSIDGVMEENETISFTDESFEALDYLYDFGDGLGSQVSDPEHVYPDAGQYVVEQTVIGAEGCRSSTDLLVSIISVAVLDPQLPNAFSPNGDGENDIFYVRGGPFSTVHMEIYNGWGELIFETDDPLFGWDGTIDGSPEQTGTYVYTVLARTTDGVEYKRAGKIALIR